MKKLRSALIILAILLAGCTSSPKGKLIQSNRGGRTEMYDLANQSQKTLSTTNYEYFLGEIGNSLYFEGFGDNVIETDLEGREIANIPLPQVEKWQSTDIYFVGERSISITYIKFTNVATFAVYRLNGNKFDLVLASDYTDPKWPFVKNVWTNSKVEKVLLQTGMASGPQDYLVYDVKSKKVTPIKLDGKDQEIIAFVPTRNSFAYWTDYDTVAPCLREMNLDTGKDSIIFCGYPNLIKAAWSPDGKYIAATFFKYPPSDTQLLTKKSMDMFFVIVDNAKGNFKQTTANHILDFNWSPDGKYIAIICDPDVNRAPITVDPSIVNPPDSASDIRIVDINAKTVQTIELEYSLDSVGWIK